MNTDTSETDRQQNLEFQYGFSMEFNSVNYLGETKEQTPLNGHCSQLGELLNFDFKLIHENLKNLRFLFWFSLGEGRDSEG